MMKGGMVWGEEDKKTMSKKDVAEAKSVRRYKLAEQ